MKSSEKQSVSDALRAQAAQLLALADEIEDNRPVLPDDAEKLLAQRVCLQCRDGVQLESGHYHRGLCTAHYHQARRVIAANPAREARMITEGLLAPRRTGGRKDVDASLLEDFLRKEGKEDSKPTKSPRRKR